MSMVHDIVAYELEGEILWQTLQSQYWKGDEDIKEWRTPSNAPLTSNIIGTDDLLHMGPCYTWEKEVVHVNVSM